MSQTRTVAKNTFGEGLIMDFAPDNTLANLLTNALNATLLTYNGNEMSLLNDMGNGRVETAFLPEGYIPMGTCEFGGIIYIVSYNPQDNLCQIGSFPSPERNITKEDSLDTSLLPPSINRSNFLELEGGNPTGKLNSLVSKVIIREDSLNPGDKFLVYLKGRDAYSQKDLECLSGLLSGDGKESKRVKLSVVAIEDSGKITKLNTTNYKVKLNNNLEGSYYIPLEEIGNSSQGPTDIDAYRKLVSQNYNVFSSKVPGKLAILAELEVISTFSCGHHIVTTENGNDITYDMYLDYTWDSENPDINPKYITLTDFTWKENFTNNTYAIYYEDEESKKDEITLSINTNYTNSNNTKYSWKESPSFNTLKGRNSEWDFGDSDPVTGTTSLLIDLPYLINGSLSYFYYENKSKIPSNLDNLKKASYLGSYFEEYNKYFKFNTGEGPIKLVYTSEELNLEDSQIGEIQINNDLKLSNSCYLCSITIPKLFGRYAFRLPYTLSYTITPAMDFGLLEHLSVSNLVDFSLINTKTILPSGIKYFVSSDLLTLSISSDVYEEEHHKVIGMGLEFYDHNGFCGMLKIDNRESYSGNIVLNIPLNSLELEHYKYNDPTLEYFHYVSQEIKENTAESLTIEDPTGGTNDCGALFSNMVYGVKLIYKYATLDSITGEIATTKEPELITHGFWLFTNGQFNDEYYTVDDFTNLHPYLPLEYGYTLQDDTKKTGVKLKDNTKKDLQELLNKPAEDLEKISNVEYTTLATYSGRLYLDVMLGVPQTSIFGLRKLENNLSKPSITFLLQSPYSKENCILIEELEEVESENSDEEQENTVIKLYELPANSKFNLDIEGPILMQNDFHIKTSIYLELPNLEFKVNPYDFKKEVVNTTVLTPILYSTDGYLNFNYYDVGGEKLSSALCFVGSDDNEADEHFWYSISFDDYAETYHLLHAYPGANRIDNIVEGHESLKEYYNSLGNRQLFTLFNVQKYDLTNDGTYKYKWSHNIVGPGNVESWEGWQTVLNHTRESESYIAKQSINNNRSEYTPASKRYEYNKIKNSEGMSYIPAFITPRIAYGGNEVHMCSGGGDYIRGTSLEGYITNHIYTKFVLYVDFLLPYTALQEVNINTYIYPQYLHTLKSLLTVNPDFKICEMSTFTYKEEDCKALDLLSIVSIKLNNLESLEKNLKKLVTFRSSNSTATSFETYTNSLLNKLNSGETKSVLSDLDPNINFKIDGESLGSKEALPLVNINYRMPHEHALIDKYLDSSYGILKYPNVCRTPSGSIDWSEEDTKDSNKNQLLIKIDFDIISSKFYFLRKDSSDFFSIEELTSTKHKANKYGYIETPNIISSYTTKTNQKYFTNKYPIFYNTTITIDDLIWDVNNPKHLLLFNPANSTLVDDLYAYLLDDQYGNGHTYQIARPYYIGPSFVHKLEGVPKISV